MGVRVFVRGRKSARLRVDAPGVAVHADRLEKIVERAFAGKVVRGLHALRGEARVILAESEVAASRAAGEGETWTWIVSLGGSVGRGVRSERSVEDAIRAAWVRGGPPQERFHVHRPRIGGAARVSVRAERVRQIMESLKTRLKRE